MVSEFVLRSPSAVSELVLRSPTAAGRTLKAQLVAN